MKITRSWLRRTLQYAFKIAAGLTVITALVVALWYVFLVDRHPSSGSPAFPSAQSTEPPRRYCTASGGVCLTPPDDWRAVNSDPALMALRSPGDGITIAFGHGASDKVIACASGDCLLKTVAIEDIAQLPGVNLVKAVAIRQARTVNAPTMFLIRTSDIKQYGFVAGKVTDMRAERTYSFTRVVDDRSYVQTLEAGAGTYDTLEVAEGWFDGGEAKEAYQIIRTIEASP